MESGKGSKDGFYKYMDSRRMTKENVAPLLNGASIMVRKDIEKAKVVIAFFTSVFTININLQQSQILTSLRKSAARKMCP